YPDHFDLDDHHRFVKGEPMRVCGNTAAMVSETRYGSAFTVSGDRKVHYGKFANCGDERPKEKEGSTGSCCCSCC
ncbi:MAG: methyltransferase type 11, partial [Candidatus Methanomethylophilaceae archaeon]